MSANPYFDAVVDGQTLWPHNDHLVNDVRVDHAVRIAIASAAVTAVEETEGVRPQPRLLLVNSDYAAMPLMDVMFNDDVRRMPLGCDLCLAQVQPVARLWVPAGSSVVELHACSSCKVEFDADYSPILWRD